MLSTFQEELAKWGPDAPLRNVTAAQGRRYCQQLATQHYENFSVASLFLPRRLIVPFQVVYSYCRWADDLADEAKDTAEALRSLAWWEAAFHRHLRRDEATHPVLTPLIEVIERFEIPPSLFTDLLIAFRQDQVQTRYQTFDEVLQYCRYSANPVGRMVLAMAGGLTEENAALADATCTGLQLANFWQDVQRDYMVLNRVYIPQSDLMRFGLSGEEFREKQANAAFREMLRLQVERTQEFFDLGEPLARKFRGRLRIDLELFRQGGLATLEAVRKQDYDVLAHRPTVSKGTKLKLMLRALTMLMR
jgi:squalene synthase HpnC